MTLAAGRLEPLPTLRDASARIMHAAWRCAYGPIELPRPRMSPAQWRARKQQRKAAKAARRRNRR